MTSFTSRLRGWLALSVGLALLFCGSLWFTGHARGVRDSTMATMTAQMKTVCVGRHLIDVPVRAKVSLSGEMIAGFTIVTFEETEDSFRSRVATREADIIALGEKADPERPGGLIEARGLQLPGLRARTFIYGKGHTHGFENGRRVDSEWVSIESHAHLGNLSLVLSKQYATVAQAGLAESLLARVRLRGEHEAPSASGFCVRRAVFTEPLPAHENEHVVLHVGLLGHPDMGLSLISIANGSTDEGLLARSAATDADASLGERLRVTTLRAGKRTINGIDGEEVLERVRELNFTTGYGFAWEARGAAHDNLRPYLSLNMETGTNPRPGGEPVDSSLDREAVLALWDRISSSLRRQAGAQAVSGARARPTAMRARDAA